MVAKYHKIWIDQFLFAPWKNPGKTDASDTEQSALWVM